MSKRLRHWRAEVRYLPSGLRYWWNSVIGRGGYDWVLKKSFSKLADAREFAASHSFEPTFFHAGQETRVVRRDVIIHGPVALPGQQALPLEPSQGIQAPSVLAGTAGDSYGTQS